jgi:hypothetical protein
VDVARAAQAHALRVAPSFLKIERIPFLVLVFDPEGGLFGNNVRLMRFSQEYLSYRSISETPGQPVKTSLLHIKIGLFGGQPKEDKAFYPDGETQTGEEQHYMEVAEIPWEDGSNASGNL